jgi:ribose/xylose/arabinose/galactoside ABC-type transport system permease subunit
MVYLQIDLYLQDMVAAAVIFFAVLIDAQRMRILGRLERRNIRVEKGVTEAQAAPAPP